jgi:glycosyltransferase involved in cell wall biosynthesis
MASDKRVPGAGPKKFGVVVDDFAHLAGATDFIVSFVDGLLLAADGREVVLIYRTPPNPRSLWTVIRWLRAKLRPEQSGWTDKIEQLYAAGLARLPMFVIERDERALQRLCERENIDVIGPLCVPPRGKFKIPWVGYLHDFQHKHLPKFFTGRSIRGRDKGFFRMLAMANSIVVNAKNVKFDAENFFPGMTDRILSLPFSAAAKEEWLTTDPASVCQHYRIANSYFLVSNQFWIHKRHEIAIEAFARVASYDQHVELVLTGATEDGRSLTRIEDIRALIARLGVTPRVHILGLIPKLEQIAIMRFALAVVQPTSFEGGPGGGSVFDAVALGVPTIVSDISVNREIEEYVSSYFPLDDVGALANVMMGRLRAKKNHPDPIKLLAAGNQRRILMGKVAWKASDVAFLDASGRTVRR